MKIELKSNSISKIILIHLNSQPWSPEEFSSATSTLTESKKFININPRTQNAKKLLAKAHKDWGFSGLKIHPRLDNVDLNHKSTKELVAFAEELKLPIIIDSYFDGNSIMNKSNPEDFGNLAKQYKNVNFIWAHFGGHKCMDFLMMAKRLPNVYLDISFSLLYFEGSSIETDICFGINSLNGNKVFYGSDFPDRDFETTMKKTRKIFQKNHISESILSKIFATNADNFFGFQE